MFLSVRTRMPPASHTAHMGDASTQGKSEAGRTARKGIPVSALGCMLFRGLPGTEDSDGRPAHGLGEATSSPSLSFFSSKMRLWRTINWDRGCSRVL